MIDSILLVHTNYKIYGGEDSNFIEEKRVLSNFCSVDSIQYKNTENFNIWDILSFLTNSNRNSNKIFRNSLINNHYDAVYFHNLWFKGNLGLLRISKKNNLKTIIKIHNFRYLCASTYFSDSHVKKDNICDACNYLGKGKFRFNKYFTESYLKSFFLIFLISQGFP